jgi:ribosomal protein S27AE
METANVRVAVMDSAQPGVVAAVQVDPLARGRRLGRGALRWLLLSGVGAVVVVLPLLHVCGLVLVLLAAPVAGVLAYRVQVLLGEGQVPCPKCGAVVPVPAGTAGWPARLHCGACGSSLRVRPEA